MESTEINFSPTPIEEQETIINLDYAAKCAYVYTSRVNIARKLNDMLNNHPGEMSLNWINKNGCEVSVPISWITIKPKTKRVISEERRSELSQRLAAAREAKQK